MITLYRTDASPLADEIEERLRSLVLAHRVVRVEGDLQETGLPEDTSLPALEEGRTLYTEEASIRTLLGELGGELAMSRRISGDACYRNPDRPGECL